MEILRDGSRSQHFDGNELMGGHKKYTVSGTMCKHLVCAQKTDRNQDIALEIAEREQSILTMNQMMKNEHF